MPSARALRCNSVHPAATTLRDFHCDPYCSLPTQASTHIVKAARCHEKTKAFPKSVAALPSATLRVVYNFLPLEKNFLNVQRYA